MQTNQASTTDRKQRRAPEDQKENRHFNIRGDFRDPHQEIDDLQDSCEALNLEIPLGGDLQTRNGPESMQDNSATNDGLV